MKLQARIDRMVQKGNVKAIASISLDGMFVGKGLKVIINPEGDNTDRGQNAYFYDSAEGRLPNRAVFFCDELGTIPPFDILPLFSAGRSRRLTLVPIIQSLA